MIFIITIVALILLITPLPVFAQPSILPVCAQSGNCGICDIIDVIARIFEFLLYFLGASALVIFTWGAFELMSSRGNPEKTDRAKKFITGALWGSFFVLIAWQLINVTIFVFTGTPDLPQRQTGFKLFGNPWNQICNAPLTVSEKECFGYGEGKPCEQGAGHCEAGRCKIGPNETACDYLAREFPEHFGKTGSRGALGLEPYKCQAKPDQAVKNAAAKLNQKWDCFNDVDMCSKPNFCCGKVAFPKDSYPGPCDGKTTGNSCLTIDKKPGTCISSNDGMICQNAEESDK